MNEVWTTGITAINNEDGWTAECKWQYGEIGKSGCMEGTICTTYYEPTLKMAIDYVLNTMKTFGINRTDEVDIMKDTLGFSLYTDDETYQSEEALNQLKNEALNRGWKFYIR
jgi:hypothetical protein